MSVSVYLNFAGDCRAAIEHYAKVFGSKPARIMTFGEGPANPEFPLDDKSKNLIMHAELEVSGSTIMFSDMPPGMPFSRGNEFSFIVQSKNGDELRRWFDGMKEGGQVKAELGPEFWSKLYGYVVDKFGVGWQFNLVE
jgi:Uncharacterized protein conserved in bacteria